MRRCSKSWNLFASGSSSARRLRRVLMAGVFGLLFAPAAASPAAAPPGPDPVEAIRRDAQSAYRSQSIPEAPPQTAAAEADRLTHEYRMTQEKYKLYECLLLGAVALISLFAVLWFAGQRPNCVAGTVVSASGLVFVVFGTLILVILADAEAQLTAAMGILGAVAGYLFGSMKRPEEGEGKAVEKKEPLSLAPERR